ncbi:MAG: acyltransferase, partial [Thermoplasmata archaeon]|nr:acyltransferase [Thermoplasmata archaeon]
MWVAEIRSLRGVAILGVISIHITGYFNRIDHLNMLMAVAAALDALSHFAVPLFIFVSAIALSVRYSGQFRMGVFYGRRLLTVIPP